MKIVFEKFVTIYFGNRRFYLPFKPSNIYFKENKMEIFLDDMDSYVIVDGIHCHYYLSYEADNDIIHTRLKDFELDGLQCPEVYPLSFAVSAKSFPVSKSDARAVVPKRDYSEITSAFLSEQRDLDERIIKFLEKHPEVFDQVDITIWEKLSKHNLPEMDADMLEEYLTKPVADLFREETLS